MEAQLEPNEMIDRVKAFIAERGQFTRVEIENFKRMPGGTSREIWSFDAVMTGAKGTSRRSLVIRLDPAGSRIESSRRQEFLVMQAAYREGVRVPEMFWLCEDPSVLGAPFFIMERVEGETIARKLLRDDIYAQAREIVIPQMAEILAKFHAVDPARHGFDLPPAPGESPARFWTMHWDQIYRSVTLDPHPTFELAIRWLLENIPPKPKRLSIIHGDYRVGNIIFGPEGVRAVIDFEIAHLGDPLEDLGWFCMRAWRSGQDNKAVCGLTDREVLYDAYEKASGIPVDRHTMRFWEVFGNLRWGIFTMVHARTYLDLHVPNVELASIGRRTAETELEILNLIG